MMSRDRAQDLAEALRKMYPKHGKRIDAEVVRMFCMSSAEAERASIDPEWLERGPVDVVAAWVAIDELLR